MKTHVWIYFLLLSAGVVQVPVAHAQAAAPADTIQWQRYYPLAVGNIWEYHGAETPGDLTRYEILSDTIVGGRQYFRRRVDRRIAGFPYPQPAPSFDFMRYDEGGGVVRVDTPDTDTLSLRLCAMSGFERNLRLGFGARLVCPPEPGSQFDSVQVRGQYNVEWSPYVLSGPSSAVQVAAVKDYTVGGVIFTTFVADVGPVGEGNLWGPLLHYARIGGTEYGRAELAVSVEPASPRPGELYVRALQNPVRNRATFEVQTSGAQQAAWEVVDVLGRVVQRGSAAFDASSPRLEVETEGLGSGLYHLLVRAHAEAGGTSFVVLR